MVFSQIYEIWTHSWVNRIDFIQNQMTKAYKQAVCLLHEENTHTNNLTYINMPIDAYIQAMFIHFYFKYIILIFSTIFCPQTWFYFLPLFSWFECAQSTSMKMKLFPWLKKNISHWPITCIDHQSLNIFRWIILRCVIELATSEPLKLMSIES